MLLARLGFLALFVPALALAQRETSVDSLARVEESLTARIEDGALIQGDLQPAIVVSVMPAFEETKTWYPTAALQTLVRVLGASSIRSCEACMTPRLYVQPERLEENFNALTTEEIIRLDENSRGNAPPAKTAIWLDENPHGVSLRIIDLRNGRVLVAENFDPGLREMARTRRNFTLTRELERRSRGDSLTHTFLDVAVYPGQHISLDWAEQWGATNCNLSGVTLSLFDPVIGVGAHYFRVIPSALNIAVGVKVILSVPTALVQGISGDSSTELIDPLLTGVAMVRIPIATSNYGVILSASTNGRIGVGLSLMNISLFPVIP